MTDVQHQTICINPESTPKVKEPNHINSQQQPIMTEIKNDIQHIQQDSGVEEFTYLTEDYRYLSQNTDINQWYYDEFSGIYRQNEYGGGNHHQQQLDKSNIAAAAAAFHSLPITASHSDISLSTDSNKDSVTTASQTSSIHRVDSHKDAVSDYHSSTSSSSSSSSLSYLNYTSKFSSSSISFLQSNPKSNTIIHPFPWPESVDRISEWCELAKTSKDPNAKLKLCQRLLLTLSIDDSDRIQEKTKNKLLYQQNKKKATNITATAKSAATTMINQQESLQPSPERNKIRKTMMLECLRLLKKLSGGQSLGKGGDSEAQYILANCYGMGLLGLTEDHSKAFQWYVQASKQSHPEATYRTAVCHELGIGTRQDGQRALVFYRKAAHLAHVGSMYKLGIILLRGYYQTTPMPREAISWLQRAASHHQVEPSSSLSIKANNNMSRPLSMLTDLTNTSSSSSANQHSNNNHKNITLSSSASASSSSSTNTSIQQDMLHDYASSSILDHLSSSSSITLNPSYQSSHALHALAMIQLTGEVGDATSLIADPVYALELLQQAAQSGYIPSQVQLGHCYEHGQWVTMDDALSIYWYARAAEQGNPEGCLALSGWYLTGSTTKGVLMASDKEAYLWARRAAITMVQATEQWTVAKAHYAVAIFLERGIGVKQDVEKAKKWLLRAAVLGHAGAKHSLLSKEEQQEWLLQQQKISNKINKSRKQYDQQQQQQQNKEDGQKIEQSKEEEKIQAQNKNQENKNKSSNAADSTCTVM